MIGSCPIVKVLLLLVFVCYRSSLVACEPAVEPNRKPTLSCAFDLLRAVHPGSSERNVVSPTCNF